MTNWYQKIKAEMIEAIDHNWDGVAVQRSLDASYLAQMGRITWDQAREIMALYDAWEATWSDEEPETTDTNPGDQIEEVAPAEEATSQYSEYENLKARLLLAIECNAPSRVLAVMDRAYHHLTHRNITHGQAFELASIQQQWEDGLLI